MTITVDLSNNLLNIILAIIGIGFTVGTTWYFTRRHYVKESRTPTENDVVMQQNKLEFWLLVILLGGALLIVPFLIAVLAFTGP